MLKKLIDKKNQISSIYHSVPKSVMLDPKYLSQLQSLSKNTKHILDCPESNLPMLARSAANHFTDSIKMVCPLMFPGVTSTQTMEVEFKGNEFESI